MVGELHRLKRTRIFSAVSNTARQLLGFDRRFTRSEFESTLEDYRQRAFLSTNVRSFASYYLLSEVFSKYMGDDLVETTDEDRQNACNTAFWTAEDRCRATNSRLAGWGWVWNDSSSTRTMLAAARLVREVLGPLDLNELPSACGFGPGASTALKREMSSQQNKWQNARHITARALPYYTAFYHWAGLELLPHELEIVDGNKIASVPKSWKTRRSIAIEPCWNGFFQKGFGRLIRRRLQRYGLLLKDAQEHHGRLAKIGSRHGKLATLDLKAASDTLSWWLVKALLPPEWFQHLDALRSEVGVIEGGVTYSYEKFSSMGNGFTFELETLIFWALAVAASGRNQLNRVSVYGDDIIMPSESVAVLRNALEFCGLELNEKKSFWGSHPFRESCGKHYFKGEDVTPFYIRSQLRTAGGLITLGNNAITWAVEHYDPTLVPLWETAFRVLPPELRGPMSCSSSLRCPWDKAVPEYNPDTQSFKYLTITRQAIWTDVWTWSGSYLFKLWIGMGDEYDAVEASYLSDASSREVVGEAYVDACAWD